MSTGRRHRRLRSLRCLAVVATLAATVVAGCAPSPSPSEGEAAVDLSFEQYALGNGLHVILRRDPKAPIAAVNLWYHVGPANESADRTGFAHLFEHMMFQGSGHTAKDAYFPLLEGVGATDVNGTTSFDRTNYSEQVPANALERALWLESDRMGFLLDSLDQAELSNQQSVVRNERRETIEVAPYGLSDEALYQQLFPQDHPYRAKIMGSHADIQAAELDEVRDFFRKFYVPNNASLAIVGDIDVPATKALVEKYFGSIPRGADVPAPRIAVPKLTAEKRLRVTDQVQLPRVAMAWVTPPAYAPGDAEADVAARLLAGSKASRLYESMVQRTNIAQEVTAYQQSLRYGSVFQIEATAKPGHTAEELEAAIQNELDALAATGPAEPELTAAKTKLRSDLLFGLEDLGEVADTLNRYDYYVGDAGYLDRDLRRYADVTAPAVQRFVTEQLRRDARVVVQTVPGRKVIPPEPPRPPAPAVTPPAPPRPPSAEPWRTAVPAPGPAPAVSLPAAQRFELPNGLPVYLIENHGLPLAVASLTSRGGSAADPPGRPGLAKFTLKLMEEGTATRDAQAVAREIDALGASFDTEAGDDGSSLTVAALTQRMGEAMTVMSDVVRSPAFPPGEVDRVRSQALAALQQQADNAEVTAEKVTRSALYGERHPYGHLVEGTAAAVRSFTREDVLRFHQATFTPGNSALVLAGDLTMRQARELAGDAFGAWSGVGASIPRPGPPAAPDPVRVIVVDSPGAAQTALSVAQPALARTDPDFDELRMMNAVLGGGFSNRVNLDLRERLGYTYGAYSQLSGTRGVGPIAVRANAQTQFTGASVREMLREVASMQTVPATDQELNRARESITQQLPANFVTNDDAAASVGRLFLQELPPDSYQRLPATLAGITAEDIQAVARKYLRPDEMVVVAVGDRSKIDSQLAGLGLGPIEYRTPDGGRLPQ